MNNVYESCTVAVLIKYEYNMLLISWSKGSEKSFKDGIELLHLMAPSIETACISKAVSLKNTHTI